MPARLPALIVRRLHRDQSGSISVVSVFALLILTGLLGMVVNSGQQIDQKIKLQNAADAATYSGGVVLARSMNTLAFTNHLLSDVFALTAFLRESRDQGARSLTPEILLHWSNIGRIFASAEFPKFAALGQAITEKVPREEEMIRTYSEWASAAAELMLPVTEMILQERLIPNFQRDLVSTTPQLAQIAAQDVAWRHGQAWPRRIELQAALWRTSVDPVGGMGETERRTLPVVDPVGDQAPNQQAYKETAVRGRERLAHTYLRHWNDESMMPFDRYAKMSRFSTLWRCFTCGHLKYLLEVEYPDTNLPHVIRTPVDEIDDVNRNLEQDFMFVGVVYRPKLEEMMPVIFSSPIQSDTLAYAQIMLFVPTRRLVKIWPGDRPISDQAPMGGVPGEPITLDTPSDPDQAGAEAREWYPGRQWAGRYPTGWDLWTQNWTVQMAPATAPRLAEILSTPPQIEGVAGVQPPNLGALTRENMRWLSNH